MSAVAEYVLDSVTHTFPGRDAPSLVDVDIAVPRGKVTALIGPSGCGKSTVLNMLAGLLAPSQGRVSLDGSPVTAPPERVGIMFQRATLLPWRTALENVLLPMELREGRRARARYRTRAKELLELVGLGGFEDAYPRQLSGGMAQRAAICRMLIGEPGVLLLDEPFGALDELTRERMDIELQNVAAQTGATVVLVTHSIPEAAYLADRVYVMAAHPGRISQIIDIDVPHPRPLDATDPAMAPYLRELRRALDKGHAHE